MCNLQMGLMAVCQGSSMNLIDILWLNLEYLALL